MIVWVTFF